MQAARLAAEQGNERSRQQVLALVAQLNDVQRLRVQADLNPYPYPCPCPCPCP